MKNQTESISRIREFLAKEFSCEGKYKPCKFHLKKWAKANKVDDFMTNLLWIVLYYFNTEKNHEEVFKMYLDDLRKIIVARDL